MTILGCLKQLFIYYFDKHVIFYFTRGWKPSASNQMFLIIKMSAHSKISVTFVESLFTLKPFKAVYR